MTIYKNEPAPATNNGTLPGISGETRQHEIIYGIYILPVRATFTRYRTTSELSRMHTVPRFVVPFGSKCNAVTLALMLTPAGRTVHSGETASHFELLFSRLPCIMIYRRLAGSNSTRCSRFVLMALFLASLSMDTTSRAACVNSRLSRPVRIHRHGYCGQAGNDSQNDQQLNKRKPFCTARNTSGAQFHE